MSCVVPNLSVTYLKSAVRFAKKSHKIEMGNKQFYENDNLDLQNPEVNNKVCELMEEDQCYSIASVIHAWMFIEAYINEYLCRSEFEYNNQISSKFANFWGVYIQETNLSESKSILRTVFRLTAETLILPWPFKKCLKYCKSDIKDILKAKTLDKYQRALNVDDQPLFEKGREPYQSIQHLRELRNAMVHYNPEAWGDDIETFKKTFSETLEKSGLKSKIKTLNPFEEKTDNPFFPDKCFGYGCAKWAVQSSVNFVEEFSKKMGLKVEDEWFKEAKELP